MKRPCFTLLAVLLLAAALPAAAACGGGDREEEFDAEQVVRDAADRLEQVQSFHFLLTHQNGGTRIVQDLLMTRAEGDVARPDRLRADVEVETGGLKGRLSVIGIQDQTWITNLFNPSQWQPLEGTDVRDVLNLAAVPEVMRRTTDVEAAGTERVNGTECYRVRARVDSAALAAVVPRAASPGQQVTVELWVGKDDSLVRRLTVRGRLNPNEDERIERRLELSGFDAPVTIQPPQ